MSWTLQTLFCVIDDRHTTTECGNHIKVVFELRFRPVLRTRLGRVLAGRSADVIEDPPRLRWFENRIHIDHTSRQRWERSADQYELFPNSPPFAIWKRAYPEAHKARVEPNPSLTGTSRLLDLDGMPVVLDQGDGSDDAKRRGEVQRYLARQGGILQVKIPVTATVRLTPVLIDRALNVDELLLVDCGVAGSTRRLLWSQHLVVNTTLPVRCWSRVCERGWLANDLYTPRHYTKVDPPPPGLQQAGAAFTPAH
jgi:hypothetical protein